MYVTSKLKHLFMHMDVKILQKETERQGWAKNRVLSRDSTVTDNKETK